MRSGVGVPQTPQKCAPRRRRCPQPRHPQMRMDARLFARSPGLVAQSRLLRPGAPFERRHAPWAPRPTQKLPRTDRHVPQEALRKPQAVEKMQRTWGLPVLGGPQTDDLQSHDVKIDRALPYSSAHTQACSTQHTVHSTNITIPGGSTFNQPVRGLRASLDIFGYLFLGLRAGGLASAQALAARQDMPRLGRTAAGHP